MMILIFYLVVVSDLIIALLVTLVRWCCEPRKVML